MQSESPRQPGGSNRRRQRNPRHSTQRNYASENDAANTQPRLPQTPQKSASTSPAPGSLPNGQRSSKRGPREGPRLKNLPLSPESARSNQATPQSSSVPKVSDSAVFAGATFHASPAPASLPMPSFFGKGGESPTGKPAPSLDMKAPSQQTTNFEMPTPLRLPPSPRTNDSPLEFMFKADREEKERARRASSANIGYPTHQGNSHSPSPSPRPLGGPRAFQAPNFGSPSPIRYTVGSTSKMSSVDAYSQNGIGPAFSTPYQERIRAAKNSGKLQDKRNVSEPHHPSPGPADRSEALKRFLFAASTKPAEPSPVAPAPASAGTATSTPNIGQAEIQEVRDAEIITMENNLRQMLRLDPSMGAR